MGRYIIRRLVYGVITIWLVTLIVFFGLRLIVPIFYGDAIEIAVGLSGAIDDKALIERRRAELDLDKPLPVQYVSWLTDVARGDLGRSLFNGRPVLTEIKNRLPVSLELGLVGLLSAVIIAIPFGVVAALAQDRWPDYALRVYAVGSSSVPGFWLAILIITFASIWWRWAPSIDFAYFHDDPIKHIKIMLLPALLIGLTPSGGLVRIMRSQMLEVLRQDYVRTARAKGLAESVVVMRHAVRNGIIPVITIIGLSLPGLIAGTPLFERIFVLPGMGNYLIASLGDLDYPVIQSTNLIFAILIVGANLIVDISYSLIDPRIRYS
ncbi:MAG: ABC transporter permease [Chloroflexi bacterium]|nr:ABC transporter permease [Chloroflexota bacterium]